MKQNQPVRSSVRALGAALFDSGLRVREQYDELVLTSPGYDLRVFAAERAGGWTIRCSISVAEHRLAAGYGETFNEIALEGYPVVAFGAGGGRATFDFLWFHPAGAAWRISGQHCQVLIDRVIGALVPLPARKAASLARAFDAHGPLAA